MTQSKRLKNLVFSTCKISKETTLPQSNSPGHVVIDKCFNRDMIVNFLDLLDSSDSLSLLRVPAEHWIALNPLSTFFTGNQLVS